MIRFNQSMQNINDDQGFLSKLKHDIRMLNRRPESLDWYIFVACVALGAVLWTVAK